MHADVASIIRQALDRGGGTGRGIGGGATGLTLGGRRRGRTRRGAAGTGLTPVPRTGRRKQRTRMKMLLGTRMLSTTRAGPGWSLRPRAGRSLNPRRRGLTLVHVRAQLEQLQNTFMT